MTRNERILSIDRHGRMQEKLQALLVQLHQRPRPRRQTQTGQSLITLHTAPVILAHRRQIRIAKPHLSPSNGNRRHPCVIGGVSRAQQSLLGTQQIHPDPQHHLGPLLLRDGSCIVVVLAAKEQRVITDHPAMAQHEVVSIHAHTPAPQSNEGQRRHLDAQPSEGREPRGNVVQLRRNRIIRRIPQQHHKLHHIMRRIIEPAQDAAFATAIRACHQHPSQSARRNEILHLHTRLATHPQKMLLQGLRAITGEPLTRPPHIHRLRSRRHSASRVTIPRGARQIHKTER